MNKDVNISDLADVFTFISGERFGLNTDVLLDDNSICRNNNVPLVAFFRNNYGHTGDFIPLYIDQQNNWGEILEKLQIYRGDLDNVNNLLQSNKDLLHALSDKYITQREFVEKVNMRKAGILDTTCRISTESIKNDSTSFTGLAVRAIGYTGDSSRFIVDEQVTLRTFGDGYTVDANTTPSERFPVMWKSPFFKVNRLGYPIKKPSNELERELMSRLSVRITETNLRQVKGWVEVEIRINDTDKPYLPYLTFIDCLETTEVIIGRDFELDIEFVNSHNDQIRFTVDPENKRYEYDKEHNVLIDKRYKRVIWGIDNSTIPADVISIGPNAFEGCKKLNSIVIPNNICEICDDAFLKCKSLTNINIPATVERIRYPFKECIKLSQATIEGNTWILDDTFVYGTKVFSASGKEIKIKDMGMWGGTEYGQLLKGKEDE